MEADLGRYSVEVLVDRHTVSEPFTPFAVRVDFGRLLASAGDRAVFASRSVSVKRVDESGVEVTIPHALSEDFTAGDAGDVSWLLERPSDVRYRVYFDSTAGGPFRAPRGTALVGNGDVLRYNSGSAEPLDVGIAVQMPVFVDWDGDGVIDLIQGSTYANTLGFPYHGSWFFRNIGSNADPLFDDFVRLKADEEYIDTQVFAAVDWDGDGLVDLVGKPYYRNEIHVYRNTGRKDRGGLPLLTLAERIDFAALIGPGGQTGAGDVHLADLFGDGRWHLVACMRDLQDKSPLGHIFGPYYDNSILVFENSAPRGKPPRFERPRPVALPDGSPLSLKGGAQGCIADWNGDGVWDVLLAETQGFTQHMRLFRNAGTNTKPRLVDAGLLNGGSLTVAGNYYRSEAFRGFLVMEKDCFFRRLEDVGKKPGDPVLRDRGPLLQVNGRVSVGQYSFPCVVDWDGDGGRDIVAGNAGGSPHVLEEVGRSDPPVYRPMRLLESAGKPVWHVWGNTLTQTGGECTEGYWQPTIVDWDGDGLDDLLAPVGIAISRLVEGKPAPEGRLFFYKNVGSRTQPRYAEAREILLEDGSPPMASDVAFPVDWDGDGRWDLVGFGLDDALAVFSPAGNPSEAPLVVKRTATLTMRDGSRFTRKTVYDCIGHLWGIVHAVADWDGRGTWDVLVGTCESLWLFRNEGTNRDPRYAPGERMKLWGADIKHSVHSLRPWPIDWDHTGRVDLLVGSESGWFHLFRRPALVGGRPGATVGDVRASAQ